MGNAASQSSVNQPEASILQTTKKVNLPLVHLIVNVHIMTEGRPFVATRDTEMPLDQWPATEGGRNGDGVGMPRKAGRIHRSG